MWRAGVLGIAVAALAAVGCVGGSDSGDKAKQPAANASSMHCLTLSVEAPKPYAPGDTEADGVEQGVEPLLTKGAKGAEMLTGQLGAVVIEYPGASAATAALREARESRESRKLGTSPKRIELFGRTLFIDYAHDLDLRRVVQGCGLHPDRPPPTP
jgi:hypothetical protein